MGELAAARDRVDADQVERRRREDEAFARYAAADLDAQKVTAERDTALADLDQQQVRVRDVAETKLAAVEERQRAVLAELNSGGRSAEDLAAVFGLPLKRVRTQLRAAKAGDATTNGHDAAPDRSPTSASATAARGAAAAGLPDAATASPAPGAPDPDAEGAATVS
ncbi:translation initiation factor IF-2 [Pseudonocardia sp. KRD291]|uniref:translation initiation factor IF-2 n=1 Tax=Pseudonocardia sp. KRD291 TaxID=2792007 RepID=UPI0027E35D9A|nr:translation initiation factor IF-2 [Pseudonocardia sp. KRD291]